MARSYSITTTLPYVNADPHIGFALEIIQADVLARYHRLLEEEVVFNTGTDEHGQKIYQNAVAAGLDPKIYCDQYAEKFHALKAALNLSYTHFIRTTDTHHIAAAQEFWRRCKEKGDIYKKFYQIQYCIGCELEKTDSELIDGRCPIHPNRELEVREEENYFFRFSRYQESLLKLYAERPDFVVPSHRLEEIRKFVFAGLHDFSISRIKEKMPWGVPVPGDDDHVMYVWFDALVNYISTLGWLQEKTLFSEFWPSVQVAGKDNLRQQSAMWQAMLMSADVECSKQIFIHGFITHEGQKMSKSLGNVVDPLELVEKYGTDAVRFYLLGAIPAAEDGDFSIFRFEEFYTAHLANGVGNLTARILTMIENFTGGYIPSPSAKENRVESFWKAYTHAMEAYKFDEMIHEINALITHTDVFINETKPWERHNKGEGVGEILYMAAELLRHIGIALLPVLPEAAERILAQLGIDSTRLDSLKTEQQWGKLPEHGIIHKQRILFPRLSA